jgi:two-component SAPR family response regulator
VITTLVLAVDDEPGMLKLTEVALSSGGYEVVAFDDPRDALEELANGLRPDVIVSDITMPTMDGFGFYAAVRELPELRAVPFLFLTAHEDRGTMRRGMSLGADDYLTKPFASDELVKAVEVRLRRVAELRRPLEGTVIARGFGHPVVERDGERLDWDSLKALELLFYLLEHRGGVGTFEVAEALWPGKTESRASSSFHTTLYRLRKVMGGEMVEAANRRYYLHDKISIDYDVDRYRELAQRARTSGRPQDYRNALELYRGHFLMQFESAWIDHLRSSLQGEQLTLLEAAAQLARSSHDLVAATELYQRMIEHEPYSAEGWDGLADTWDERGEPGRARDARDRFDRIMSEG